MNAKSIIMVLAQSFIMGTTVVISADGEDEQQAVDTLAALADSFSE